MFHARLRANYRDTPKNDRISTLVHDGPRLVIARAVRPSRGQKTEDRGQSVTGASRRKYDCLQSSVICPLAPALPWRILLLLNGRDNEPNARHNAPNLQPPVIARAVRPAAIHTPFLWHGRQFPGERGRLARIACAARQPAVRAGCPRSQEQSGGSILLPRGRDGSRMLPLPWGLIPATTLQASDLRHCEAVRLVAIHMDRKGALSFQETRPSHGSPRRAARAMTVRPNHRDTKRNDRNPDMSDLSIDWPLSATWHQSTPATGRQRMEGVMPLLCQPIPLKGMFPTGVYFR
jgi:hypothetical protein